MNTADIILKSYMDNLGKLSSRRRLHFLLRSYRISGDKKYIPLIRASYYELLPKFKEVLGTFSSEEAITEKSANKILNYNSEDARKMRRFSYYKKNPKVLIYDEAILYMFLIKSLGMEDSPEISREFEIAKKYMEDGDVENIFLDRDFMKVNPSESANMINFLAFLGIADKRLEFIKLSRYWLTVEPSDASIWLDKIYGLVHLIIGASNYYQNFVDKKEFEWILKYFESDFRNILEKASIDTIGEIGVCFKLVGDDKNRIVDMIRDFLISKFDKKEGYIPHERKGGIVAAEHKNIIALIVLTDFGKLYKGPDIRT